MSNRIQEHLVIVLPVDMTTVALSISLGHLTGILGGLMTSDTIKYYSSSEKQMKALPLPPV